MCREIRNKNEEIVWFFGATAYLLPILFAKLLGRTVVLQPRGDVPLTLQIQWEQRVPKFLARFFADIVKTLEEIGYRLADAIVTYTPTMASELGLDRHEEKLYPDGARYIDTNKFYPHTPYNEREQVVGFLGRLDEEKRIRELADVAKRLPEDMKFVFAGDGDLREWLKQELSEEIESGSVEMLGWVDREEVPEVLSRFRLLVLPSQSTEGLPTVILEAFACGTPVYATPVSGVPDLVEKNRTGFRMTEINPRQISKSIEKIITGKKTHRISKNACDLIESEYTFDAAVARYQSIITDIQNG